MQVTVIPVVVGVLGTITINLGNTLDEPNIKGRIKIIQTRALLKSAWILRRVLVILGDWLSLKLQSKTTVKLSIIIIVIIIIIICPGE